MIEGSRRVEGDFKHFLPSPTTRKDLAAAKRSLAQDFTSRKLEVSAAAVQAAAREAARGLLLEEQLRGWVGSWRQGLEYSSRYRSISHRSISHRSIIFHVVAQICKRYTNTYNGNL
jgi:hypothetical protein